MNNNGYIRKIDELGRIVIPKEIRQKLKITEGENLLINYKEKNINLSKYSYIENNIKFINLLADKVNFLLNYNIIICDKEKIIFSTIKSIKGRMSSKILEFINNRESFMSQNLNLNDEFLIEGNVVVEPIISSSTSLGCIILYTTNKDAQLEKICKLLTHIITFYIEGS